MAKRKINGIFLLDKPEGISSSSALVKCRAIFKAQKGGHTGALDPLASGLLPICLGEAAKFSSFFLEGNKRYLAQGTLGVVTTTGDREGDVVIERDIGNAMERLEETLEQFRGPITQVPPIYSAIKVDGKPLYKYARQGLEEQVEIPKREVVIHELKLIEKTANTFTVEVYCSKGTYIRTLIADIGEALGCGAYVTHLRRTFVEGLPEGEMTSLENLQKLANERNDKLDFSALDSKLISIADALDNLPRVDIPLSVAEPLSNGVRQGPNFAGEILCQGGIKPGDMVQVRYHDYFMGVCYFTPDNVLVPKRLMAPELFREFRDSLRQS